MSVKDDLGLFDWSEEEFEAWIASDSNDVDDILERWLNGEDVSDFEDDGAQALTKEEYDG